MPQFDLSQYQTVQERIDLFWAKHPEGRFKLDIVSMTDSQVVIKASVWTDRNEKHPATVDFAEERIGTSPVNKVSHVENCATSALGRAISALGGEFSPKGKRPSRSEMEKVARATENKATSKDWLAMATELGNDIEGLRLLYSQAKTANATAATLNKIQELATSDGQTSQQDTPMLNS